MARNRKDYYAKKRARGSQEETDVGVMDADSNRLLIEMEREETDAISIVINAARSPASVAQKQMLALQRVQCHMLSQYDRLLKKSSMLLSAQGCWQFLELHLKEANRIGVGEELRHLTFQSAAEFADKRMAQLTRKYKEK